MVANERERPGLGALSTISTAAGSSASLAPAQQAGEGSLLAAALGLASRGWHVFPVAAGGGRPAVDRWEQRATTDEVRIGRAWSAGRYNIGLACGPAGLVVIDLDTTAHGAKLPPEWASEPGVVDGRDVLAVLVERAGQRWPDTFTVVTPSGGWHLYFLAPSDRRVRNSASRLGPMVDVRAAGGYVVAPGSLVDGRPYRVLVDVDPAPLPGWLAELAAPAAPAPTTPGRLLTALVADQRASNYAHAALVAELERVLAAGEGQRNHTLNRAAYSLGQLVGAGRLRRDDTFTALVRAGQAVGLGEREAENTVRSGMTGGMAHPRGASA